MKYYMQPNKDLWTGRSSNDQLYLHEKIICHDLKRDAFPDTNKKSFALLGYACDEGVRRNHGRIGAKEGPDVIRKMLAPLSNHFSDDLTILDIGNITCPTGNLEETQLETSNCIATILKNQIFPIVVGGGHDLAYAHYNGIKKQFPEKRIGIINFDAHFDLRVVKDQGNSGTPFYQIAKENNIFEYLCLGIQKEANNRELFETANKLNVNYLFNTEFTLLNKDEITKAVDTLIDSVDLVYLTIDIDGFSSAYAPGVSAPSPVGFSLNIALETIQKICHSKKLLSVDLVEFNPKYDIDHCTARLASRLIYSILQELQSI
ncbi:formimidoylglutamase [Aquimarina mytili]|uniref:Formimidoylglutamase n=1 Tax=Aquimarina mytili TaxID=874423 RepID=A0A936ZY10_9FLAO|nr:formimidoylglutamase [Aquimarina mytili]MBL0683221.1 formimidoylglutamase [Aquimarina mytili]